MMRAVAGVEFRPRPKADEVVQISVRAFNFYYGKFHALRNIDLDIYRHRITAFIGPSGCGKSTLLRAFNLMYKLYPEQRAAGSVLLDGKNILEPDVDPIELRHRVGMVFQKPTPFPMSIYDNIAFGVSMHDRLSRAAMDERVEWALRKGALWDEVKDKLEQSGTSLSGGQQQRLCIARCIAVKPEVLLLDEPHIGARSDLDGAHRRAHRGAQADFTIVMVTHNMQQAARVSDYTAYMYLGTLVEMGRTDSLFIKPAKRETEDYITGRFG